jgi:uncharacterized protein (DUF2147 family)
MFRSYTLLSLALVVAGLARAADPAPVGLWKTIDDKTGRPKGIVRIFERKGELFGIIVAGLQERKNICDLCKDDRKNKPLIGMEVIRHMKKTGDEFAGGEILDPESGSVYRCKLRVDDGGKKLLVRGYLGLALFGRTQTWVREH